MIAAQICKCTDGHRLVHMTDGCGQSIEIKISEDLFQELRKVFNSEAQMVEVSHFTQGKAKELVE